MALRVGVAGVGGIGKVHLANIKNCEIAELVAVCDVIPDAVEGVARQYGAAAYTDFAQMLDRERLDAVFICVPPFAHGEMEEIAARKGVHLFVEKPLGLDMRTVRRKMQVITEAGIIAGSGYCLRYHEPVQWAKSYLADKTIAMISGFYHTTFVQTPWWRKMALSGGQLVEQTTHIVDLMRYLAGDVTQVHAQMTLMVSRDIPDLDIYDAGCLDLRFTNGTVGSLTTTFTQPDHHSGVEVFGRGFRIRIDGAKAVLLEGERTEEVQSQADFYARQDLAFLQAVATGDRSLILAPYEEAVKTLAVTLAANQSARTGQAVRLTEDWVDELG